MFKDCSKKTSITMKSHNMKEATIVDHIGSYVPIIFATLDNRQVKHQSLMIEVEGMINKQPITILID